MRHKPPIIQLAIILILVLATSFSSARALTQVLPQNHSLEEMKNNSVPIEKIVQPRAIFENTDLSCYRTVDEIYALAEDWEAEKPGFVEWVDIGDSWEKTQGSDTGYDIKVLVLTNEEITEEKPVLFLMSGLHARELAPVELNLRFAEYLLENYEKDADVTWLLYYREIHLLFVANPDGRIIAEDQAASGTDPLNAWYTNTNTSACAIGDERYGVDLNRNFPVAWEYGSAIPCEAFYRGTSANSEPETQAIINYLDTLFSDEEVKVKSLFINLRSYGNQIFWPYGYIPDSPPDESALINLGHRFAFYNQYTPVQLGDISTSVSGAVDDYVYETLDIATFTFNIGAYEEGGFFTFCNYFEDYILSDNLEALIYAAKVADAPYETPFGPDITDLNVNLIKVNEETSFQVTAYVTDSQYYPFGMEVQNIYLVRYSIDTPPWELTGSIDIEQPKDGDYDSPNEEIEISFASDHLDYGRHILYMQGQDTTDQWGPVSTKYFEYEEPPPIEEDKLIFLPLIFK